MGANNGRYRREQRRDDALERQADCDKLTPQQRIDLLDKNLGKGLGAVKERARMTSLLDELSQPTRSTNKKRHKDRKGKKKRK